MEKNVLDLQREKVEEVINDSQFLQTISAVEDKEKFIELFKSKYIELTPEQVDLIFEEVQKKKREMEGMSEDELLEVTGGNSHVTVVTVNNYEDRRHHTRAPEVTVKHRREKSEPMTAAGATLIGGGIALLGTALAMAGIATGIKKGWGAKL